MAESDYVRPVATGLRKAQVFRIAEDVNAKLGLEPGDDLYPVVENLGGRIEVADTLREGASSSGSLYVDGDDDFRIIIPSHTGLKRDRFTIAHELGHFFIHYVLTGSAKNPATKKMKALRKDSERVEWEANWFAAAFLMPSEQFTEIYDDCNGDLEAVAEEFDVSYSAAEVRARSLGLV